MAEKNKNNFVVNDKTYVKKPEIHYLYKFQPYVKDLGGSPGKNITQEDRNKRLKHENNVNAVRNVVKGLNNTFGKAISGAAAFYGGGWALNRLLHLNKPSTLGQFFGRYVLPANTADNVSDGVELIFDPSVKGAVDLGSGVVLGRFKDLSKPVRLVGELIGQGANINNMKNGGLIRKMQTAAGGPLQLTPEELKYLEWSKMTPLLKREYRNNRINAELRRGPNITNFWEAFQTYIGNRDPKNPHLNTGEAPNPETRDPKLIINTVQKAKSIAERVAKISDKIWDKHYLRLVNRGETKRALTVRDLHFRAKAPNTKISSESGKPIHAYHGTGKQFTEFDTTGKYSTLDEGYYGVGAYFAPNKDIAQMYADTEKTPIVYDTYLNIKNPLRHIRDENAELYGKPIIGNDGVISKLPEDLVDETFDMTEFVATKPFLIKLANTVTHDNNGKIIPISKRDNFLLGDMRYKQGGKMNMLEFLKKGSGIHIKKKNRGKFTSYCGGKVTDECIRKAKESGNPTLVKRATFADNARHFKHRTGGIIKAEDGTKVNTFLKIGNWLNSDTGKAISGTLLNGLSAGFLAKLMNDFINEYDAASKAKLKSLLNVSSKDYISKALSTMNPNENLSSLVLLKRAYDIGMLEALKSYNEEKENIDLLMFNLKQYASLLNLNNFFNAFSQLGSLLNYTNKKTTDNGAPSNDNT